jgi:hypothetical protein
VRWVPRSLTVEHKSKRKAISSELLAWFKAEGETFFQIVTASIRTLKELGKCFKQVLPHKNPTEILLKHDTARLSTGLKTW